MGATAADDDDSGINNNIQIFFKIKIKRLICLSLGVLGKKIHSINMLDSIELVKTFRYSFIIITLSHMLQ